MVGWVAVVISVDLIADLTWKEGRSVDGSQRIFRLSVADPWVLATSREECLGLRRCRGKAQTTMAEGEASMVLYE